MFTILVDGSHKLGIKCSSPIETRSVLHDILRQHLNGLLEGKTDDEKLFWATYSYYIVYDDCVCLANRLGSYPIFDVRVQRSEKTLINCTSYKIDEYEDYDINDLIMQIISKENIEKYSKVIWPLEVLDWNEDLEQKWEGKIWVRTGFTGWNRVDLI